MIRNLLPFLIILIVSSCSNDQILNEPEINVQDLFIAGENGYHTYRIPGIVVTDEGKILAYCAARKGKGSDWDEIHVALRTSKDGGNSWSDMQIIAQADSLVTDNPMAIVDYQTGVVHFLYQVDYNRLFYMWSDNEGDSFSEPVEITEVVESYKEKYPWVVMAPGPGHGIQLSNGRLVLPVWLSDGSAKDFGPNLRGHRPSIVVSIYSDDNGKTWHPGEVVAWNDENIAVPNETSCVQLADERVMFNIRNESPNYRRLISYSEDGATNWTTPEFADSFFEPICFASMTRMSMAPYQSKNRILFANPDSRMIPRSRGRGKLYYAASSRRRENLTLRMSYDEGLTWPVKKVLEPGITGYSDLAVLPDGTILCLFEKGGMKGSHTQTESLALATFNIEWLTNNKDHLDKTDNDFKQTYFK